MSAKNCEDRAKKLVHNNLMGHWLTGLGKWSGPIEVVLLLTFAYAMAWLFGYIRNPRSGFRLREAERLKIKRRFAWKARPLKVTSTQRPFLTGIRTDAPPHEILGVTINASKKQIVESHRRLMKQYHPDKIGPPGSREWTEAQAIAIAINRAKEEMLKRLAS